MWGEELTCEQVHHHDHHRYDTIIMITISVITINMITIIVITIIIITMTIIINISRAGCLGRLRELHRSEGEQGGGESGANPMVRWEHESGNKSHSGQTVTGAIIFLQLNQHYFTVPSILLLRLSFHYFPHQVNKLGVLTINSQPSAHCVPRLIPSDKTKVLDRRRLLAILDANWTQVLKL